MHKTVKNIVLTAVTLVAFSTSILAGTAAYLDCAKHPNIYKRFGNKSDCGNVARAHNNSYHKGKRVAHCP